MRKNTVQKVTIISVRQAEILTLASYGKTYWEIGVILDIQEDTVKKHMQQICSRLYASNKGHAIAKGISGGIILPIRDRPPTRH